MIDTLPAMFCTFLYMHMPYETVVSKLIRVFVTRVFVFAASSAFAHVCLMYMHAIACACMCHVLVVCQIL